VSEEKWRVERHGGRADDLWRVVFEGSEAEAKTEFAMRWEDVRQGGLRLIDSQGNQARLLTAPRLRTRW
jgi:hypothetical protein